ncbi:MAG TPA: hypothetical protein VMQ81_00895 [Acidimicrobiia bacterium]|nr:hypothetical protein [Acidimicrobiia bacterium]
MTDPRFTVVGFPRGRELRRRLPRFLGGLPFLGVGIAMTLEARLGVSPFDVLHQGLARKTGLSFGTVVIGVGLVVLLLWIPVRQPFGIGTIINTLTVGLIIDVALRLLPEPDALAWRWPLLLGGILVTGFGTGLYIGAGLGPGPRDGLMTGIAARGHRLWVVRTVIELCALASGWALGGNAGVGTLIFAFGIGPVAHFFLDRFHLGVPAGTDLGPGVAAE